MIRLIGFLVMFAIAAGGYLYFDFKMASRWASSEGGDDLTVSEYLGGLPDRIATLVRSEPRSGLPTKLVDMLPKPPEGWTVRQAVADDVKGFLPKNEKKADKAALAYINAMAVADQGSGVEAVALTYEKGDRKVLVKASRYPNVIFTGATATDQRLELQTTGARFRGTEFMTVRGLDVTEDLLPEGFRGRYFLADVGGQIQLRVLVAKRTPDKDLIPFFDTLHVKAMNASVIDRQDGLGEVPVIVLASALDDAGREAYLAAVTARRAEAARRHEDARIAAAAQSAAQSAAEPVAETGEATGGGFFDSLFGKSAEAAPETTAKPEVMKAECTKDKNGTKHCTVGAVADE